MAILAAIVSAVVGTGLSVGVAAATQPDTPSAGKQSRKTVLASLKALPAQRQVEALARLGQKGEYAADNWMRPREAYEKGLITKDEWKYYQRLNDKKGLGIFGDLMPGTEPLTTGPNQGENKDQRKGVHGGRAVRMSDGHMQINLGKREADFTGYGDADIESQLAREMAQTGLDLQNKYGADFAEEARKQTELADPEGTAARKLLADKINQQEQARRTRERPVANSLDASVLGDLNLGSAPDEGMRDALARTLERRGDSSLTTEDVAGDMSTGLKGEARMRERLQKGMSYLGSGATPQDAAFRDEQQSMANMASFLGGKTPQSQFASLSGGGSGAAPMPQAGALPGVDSNLINNANQAGAAGYSAGVRSLTQNVSPYFMGLSALLNGATTAGKAGYKPFGNN